MVENKTAVFPVRLTPTQAEKVRDLAERDGRKMSEWFRELVRREIDHSTDRAA